MFDIHQSVRDKYGDHDEEREAEYIDGLIKEFEASAEARAVQEAQQYGGYADLLLEYAFSYLGCTPQEMSLRDFNEVVFSLIPQKVSVNADQAGAIIAELRGFWQFLARQYGLNNAKAILATLDGQATSRLQAKLADPSNFGIAKSFFMLGAQQGFDMSTPEGVTKFQDAYNGMLQSGQLAPSDLPLPLPERSSSDAIKKKRKERKRQRDAKKRNRKR